MSAVNPQAMAAVSQPKVFRGHDLLGAAADRDTWLTPRYILEQLGTFSLDPCAAEQNPNWAAPAYYTIDVDGLKRDWFGRVFMNPPFSNTSNWLARHALHGNGISLVPATVESRVWRSCVWKGARAVLLLHGRTRFCNPDGSSTTGRPLRSIALIAWTAFDADVLARSSLAGVLVTDWRQR